MRCMKPPATNIDLGSRFQPQLMVWEYVSTRKGDADRGPMIRLRRSEARIRLVDEGELVWVQGPRRKEIAVLIIDEAVPEGKVALRDIAGVTLTEKVVVTKPDLDTPPNSRQVG